jgi:hypothetical protein
MLQVVGPVSTPASTGGAGASAATVYSGRISGRIVGIFVQYNDSPPAATTDVGIRTAGITGVLPSFNVLTITNGATDGYFTPRKQAVDSTGAAIAGVYDLYVANDRMKIDLAGANDGDSVTIWFMIEND